MYTIYLFKEKNTGNIIYVGSSSRPAARMKEHLLSLNGKKKKTNIHKYMLENNLRLFKDVEVIWADIGKNRDEMIELEQKYYYKYIDTIKNDRPGENRYGWYNPKRRKVKCINDNRIFRTVTECARFYGKGRTTISGVLRGEKQCTIINGEKYYFKYVDYK